jgi:hypothetical protein
VAGDAHRVGLSDLRGFKAVADSMPEGMETNAVALDAERLELLAEQHPFKPEPRYRLLIVSLFSAASAGWCAVISQFRSSQCSYRGVCRPLRRSVKSLGMSEPRAIVDGAEPATTLATAGAHSFGLI